MGRMILTAFESELESMLGSRSIGNTRIDRWLLMAVDEITGAIDFQSLMAPQSVTMVSGTTSYDLDSNCVGISAAYDTTNKNRLLWSPPQNFITHDDATSGNPKIYTRLNDDIYLWPTPSAAGTLKVLKRIQYGTWTSGALSLPNQWDPVILALAAHYGFGALEELEQSAFWFNRAMALIRSRTTDYENDSDAEPLPVMVVSSYEDLMNLKQSDYLR